MNPIEKIALTFLKNELTANPQLASKFVGHVLTQKGVAPEVVAPVTDAIAELLPFLVAQIPA